MMHAILIAAGKAELTEKEILEIVGTDKIAELKKAGDPHPFFKAFVIAHEGFASPEQIETGRRERIKFDSESIKSMAGRALSKIVSGAHRITGGKFAGDAPEIGTEIARTQREINGRLSEIGIYYARPEQRSDLERKKFVSFEAIWDTTRTAAGLAATRLRRLYRVAAGEPGDGLSAAFSGAVELASVAAFNDDGMLLMAMADVQNDTAWITAESLAALPDEEKKRLTELLARSDNQTKSEPEIKYMEIKIDPTTGDITNPDILQHVPFKAIIKIVSSRKANASDLFPDGPAALMGSRKPVKDPVTGETRQEFFGGDVKFREAIHADIVGPLTEQYGKTIAELKASFEQSQNDRNSLAGIIARNRSAAIKKRAGDLVMEAAKSGGIDQAYLTHLEKYMKSGLYPLKNGDDAALVFASVDGKQKIIDDDEFDVDRHIGSYPRDALAEFGKWYKDSFGDDIKAADQKSEVVPAEMRAASRENKELKQF